MNDHELRDGAQMALALLHSGPIDTRDAGSLAQLVASIETWSHAVPRPEEIGSGFFALTIRGLASVAGHGIALSREARLSVAHAVDVATSRAAAVEAVRAIVGDASRCVPVQAPNPSPDRLRTAIDRYASSRASSVRA
jgi:hypothetical protein